jgi:hypothetical protein
MKFNVHILIIRRMNSIIRGMGINLYREYLEFVMFLLNDGTMRRLSVVPYISLYDCSSDRYVHTYICSIPKRPILLLYEFCMSILDV